MDIMFSKYKNEFIAAINATLDMLYNSKDLMELKDSRNQDIEPEKYREISQNILELETLLQTYKTTGTIEKEQQTLALAALGTSVVHLEYLAQCYKEAAKKAKIIIANVKNNN